MKPTENFTSYSIPSGNDIINVMAGFNDNDAFGILLPSKLPSSIKTM